MKNMKILRKRGDYIMYFDLVEKSIMDLFGCIIRDRYMLEKNDAGASQPDEDSEPGEDEEKGGASVLEFSTATYYIFDALGVNFSNSDKTQWARFIHSLTGKSYERIRRSLNFDFESKAMRKNLRKVAAIFSELFPNIEQKILNDLEQE